MRLSDLVRASWFINCRPLPSTTSEFGARAQGLVAWLPDIIIHLELRVVGKRGRNLSRNFAEHSWSHGFLESCWLRGLHFTAASEIMYLVTFQDTELCSMLTL